MTTLQIYGLLEHALGRRFLWRLGRFLYLGARREVSAAPETDGEFDLQEWIVRGIIEANAAPVILDVGANLGLWTLNMAKLLEEHEVETARIIAFEPAPEQRAALKKAISRIGQNLIIEVRETALGRAAGKAAFAVTGARTGTSHLLTSSEMGTVEVIIEVLVITIDDLFREDGISHVHFIKIDTEGNDFNVILGANTSIAGRKIDVIQFEYGSHWIDFGHSLKVVMEFARRHGYRFGRLTRRGIEVHEDWHPELDRYILANFVLLSPNAPTPIPIFHAGFDRFNVCSVQID